MEHMEKSKVYFTSFKTSFTENIPRYGKLFCMFLIIPKVNKVDME